MYAILGFLADRPMSGYDIKKAVEESVDNFWSESFGQIYPILRRLAGRGLVERVASKGGGRARHVYTITDRGRERLRRWLGESTEQPRVRNELLLKLFFGGKGTPDASRRQIEAYRERLLQDLGKYRAIEERLRRDYRTHPDLPYWLMTLRYGERDREALIAWCDEAFALLDQLPKQTRKRTRSISK
jgi:DNA-binding PadR family transcriptional regulator